MLGVLRSKGRGGASDRKSSHRHRRRLRGKLGLGLVVVLVLGLTSGAGAVITPVGGSAADALTLAQAIAADPAQLNSAGTAFDAVPPEGTPNAVENAPLAGFPTAGSSFGILTSGDATLADQPNDSGSSGTSDGGSNVRGTSDFDVTILKIGVNVPAGNNCLAFDFKFFSEEFPEYVGSSVSDSFIAELDTSDWTTTGGGNVPTAPHNFAFDSSGDPISINSTGATAMSADAAAGTTYDGATQTLSAQTAVSPGAHTIYLSIFDQGDNIFDSAVFVDNLRAGFVPDPAAQCKAGATLPNDIGLTSADAPDPVTVGGSLTYTDTVKNNGTQAATGVSFSDPLPASVDLVSATPSQGTCTGTATVACALGSLAVGASATVTIVVTPTQEGTLTNTASVAAAEPDPDPADNQATATTTVNPATAPGTFALSVGSQNPSEGVAISVTPLDLSENGDGTTPFSRVYDQGTQVQLTAPASAGGNDFVRWTQDGQNLTAGQQSVTVTMDAAHSLVAVYAPPPPVTHTLAVGSQDPGEGVAITVSPPDNSESGNGQTPFSRTYDEGTVVTLTAPSGAAGNAFEGWLIDGEGVVDSTTVQVTMDADHTATAVYNPEVPAAQPDVAVSDVSVTEGSSGYTTARFTVSLSAPSDGPVSVDYATQPGTAAAGSDFVATSGTLTFAPGQTARSVDVSVVGDTLNEANESFGLELSSPQGANIGDGHGVGTILDDDPRPRASISDASIVEGNDGTRTLTFTISLDRPSGQVIGVDWATEPGTATPGTDYQPVHGTVSFDPGETSKKIGVPIVGDTAGEANQTFYVNIVGMTNGEPGKSRGTGTIISDDGPPPPVFRQQVDAGPVSGNVTYKLPGDTVFNPLLVPTAFPIGTVIDATNGRVTLTIVDADGTVYSADFYEGLFEISEQLADGTLVLKLVGGDFAGICGPSRTLASTSAPTKKKPPAKRNPGKSVRHLWGDGKGKFRTQGRYSSATVRGTRWLTDDRCFGTVTLVEEGIVDVFDFVTRKTITLTAGQSYVAQPKFKPKKKAKHPKKKKKKRTKRY